MGEDGRVSEAEGGAGTELWIGSSPSLEATASHSISTTPCTLVLLLDSMNQTFHHKEMTSSVVNKKYDLWFVGNLIYSVWSRFGQWVYSQHAQSTLVAWTCTADLEMKNLQC